VLTHVLSFTGHFLIILVFFSLIGLDPSDTRDDGTMPRVMRGWLARENSVSGSKARVSHSEAVCLDGGWLTGTFALPGMILKSRKTAFPLRFLYFLLFKTTPKTQFGIAVRRHLPNDPLLGRARSSVG
jgi:hypothetical protein